MLLFTIIVCNPFALKRRVPYFWLGKAVVLELVEEALLSKFPNRKDTAAAGGRGNPEKRKRKNRTEKIKKKEERKKNNNKDMANQREVRIMKGYMSVTIYILGNWLKKW